MLLDSINFILISIKLTRACAGTFKISLRSIVCYLKIIQFFWKIGLQVQCDPGDRIFFIPLNAILLSMWTADGDMMASSSRHISSQVPVPLTESFIDLTKSMIWFSLAEFHLIFLSDWTYLGHMHTLGGKVGVSFIQSTWTECGVWRLFFQRRVGAPWGREGIT